MKNISLSFVIPVFNEQERIDLTFKALASLSLPANISLKEVIFVNDGSGDKTVRLIEKSSLSKKFDLKLITYSTNKGKGYALKQGMLKATGDYTLFFDADMSTPLTEIKKFVPFMKKGVPVIIGTRKNGHSTVTRHQPLYREVMGKAFTLITQVAISSEVTDFTCGFKVFSRKARTLIFQESLINRWGYDAEIMCLAKINSLKIREVPVIWANDERTKVKIIPAVSNTLIELAIIIYSHRLKRYLNEGFLPKTSLPFLARNLIK